MERSRKLHGYVMKKSRTICEKVKKNSVFVEKSRKICGKVKEF